MGEKKHTHMLWSEVFIPCYQRDFGLLIISLNLRQRMIVQQTSLMALQTGIRCTSLNLFLIFSNGSNMYI